MNPSGDAESNEVARAGSRVHPAQRWGQHDLSDSEQGWNLPSPT